MKAKLLQQIKQRFGIMGNSPALNHAIEVAVRVAETNMGVLITGENGSGKESFAKIIHHVSRAKHGKFIAVNCGAIPEGTIDSELFGHEKGSFTSASESRKGYFEEADQGTIFLDEIGEMPLHTQPRLLRVLENKEYMRVGSSKKRTSDARVVAATNVDLEEAVSKKKFREDLFYRIAQVQIPIPPLRKRGEDIYLLFRKFALDFVNEYQAELIQLTPAAKERLLKYPFPGNVRQLKNITWQIATLEARNPLITEEVLSKYLPARTPRSTVPAPFVQQTADIDQEMLYKVLFAMKKESQEIREVLFDFLRTQQEGSKILEKHPKLFSFLYHHDAPAILDDTLAPQKSLALPPSKAPESSPREASTLSLKEHEKALIKKALEESPSYKVAAKKLGIAERTLYRKIQAYDLG